MGARQKLDASRRACRRPLIGLFVLIACLAPRSFPQSGAPFQDNRDGVKNLYDGQRWDEVVAAADAADASADTLFYRGLALAHLERWPESERTFESGRMRYPRDARFPVELAGLAYRRKEFAPAKTLLRGALTLEPENQYANDLLASIYLLEGNTEAALKYWNQIGKPQLSDLIFEPRPHLKPILLDRAFLFSRGAVWKRSNFLATRAKLDALGMFPAQRFDLEPQADGTFALDFSSAERRAWRDSQIGRASCRERV